MKNLFKILLVCFLIMFHFATDLSANSQTALPGYEINGFFQPQLTVPSANCIVTVPEKIIHLDGKLYVEYKENLIPIQFLTVIKNGDLIVYPKGMWRCRVCDSLNGPENSCCWYCEKTYSDG